MKTRSSQLKAAARPYRFTFVNGATQVVHADDYDAAKRSIFNRVGSAKLPGLFSISLVEPEEESERARERCIKAYQTIRFPRAPKGGGE